MISEDFQEYMIQAKALIGSEKYEGALRYLEKAESIDKMNKDIYLYKGISYANLEKYEEAKVEFQKALKINKKEGVVYFHLGNIEMLIGEKAKGIEFYNNAIAYGFDDTQVYFSLGLMHEEEDNDDLALRNYSKAIIKDPNRADIQIRKVRLFIKNQHYPEALQSLDELLLSNPDVFEGYHLKFLVLVSLEKLTEAEEVIDSAISLFPKDTGFAIDKASLLITKKQYNEAIEYLNNISNEMEVGLEEQHSIEMEKSRVYALLEDMDKTIECLEKAKNISLSYDVPQLDMSALYLLMNCYLNIENFEKVIEYAREIKKAKEEEYYNLAAYYYEPLAFKLLGKSDEAMKLFEEAVSYYRSQSLKHPNNMDSYAFRIMALKELGRNEKALELADYLVMVNDNVAESHTLRATVLEELGRIEEAKNERAKAVSLGELMAELPANKELSVNK